MISRRIVWTLLGHALLLIASGPSRAAGVAAQTGPPAGFGGEARSITTIEWSWQDTTGESFYVVHDDETDGFIRLLSADQVSFVEEGLSENTRYRRHVHASQGGQLSPPSNAVARYTLVHDANQDDFHVAAVNSRRVDVTVVPPPHPADDQTGVEITRVNDGVVSAFAPVYDFADTNEPETRYCYVIRFRNGDGIPSAFAYPEKCVTTPPDEPPPHDCRTRLEIPASATYLPEGDATGDEMKPGNKVVAIVWWEADSLGHGPTERYLTVQLFPTSFVGQCTNSGELMFEDFTIELEDNEKDWDLGPDLVYSSTQSLIARTKKKVPRNTPVAIVLTSYDWGGFVKVHAEAEECAPQEKEAVEDFDKDLLPDAFESASQFWNGPPGGRVLTPFNPKNPQSAGPLGPRDDANDLDLDDRAAPVHGVTGDGLSAREEYRGVKVNGVVARTRDLIDARTKDRKGGTHVKDVFIHDEKAKRQGKDVNLFFPNSLYLADSGLIWHLVAEGDVHRNGAFIPMNPKPTGDADQYAVRMRGGRNLTSKGRPATAVADFSVNSTVPIQVDLQHIDVAAGKLNVSFEDLQDWVISHEIHHKFSMRHNEGLRSFVANQPDKVDLKSWWPAGAGRLECYIVVAKPQNQPYPLEFVDDVVLPAGSNENPIKAQGLTKVTSQSLPLHGKEHLIGVYATTMTTSLQNNDRPNIKLKIEAHEKNLLDPVISPDESGDVKKDPLTEEQEKKPNVRS